MSYSRRGSSDEKNYHNKVGELAVIVGGKYAGSISLYQSGFSRFDYDGTYEGPALSIRMPRDSGPFLDDIVRPWCEGLLPDNERVRSAMAKRGGLNPHDPFGLLKHYGRDCPGAAQICVPAVKPMVMSEEGAYDPITDTEIADRLCRAHNESSPDWTDKSEHWTLDGAQGKIALTNINGTWYRCHGSAASTHILKPSVLGFDHQVLDEFLCMRLAHASGLVCAHASHHEFSGIPAIVLERYDREVTPDGTVVRHHQEDLCQALGFMPRNKYKPSAMDCVDLLRRDTSRRSLGGFTSALFITYLIGATDGHAKNYSCVHLEEDDIFLAPLYDLASIFPYVKNHRGVRNAAMTIGGERRLGRLCGSHIRRFAAQCGFDAESYLNLMEHMAREVSARIEEVVDENAHIAWVEIMGPELVRTTQANCAAMLCNLDRDGSTCDTSFIRVMNSGTIPRA